MPEPATGSYFDPDADAVLDRPVESPDELDALVGRIMAVGSGRGHPGLEVRRQDGSTLSLGTDGSRACLVWIDAVGDSFHSAGGPPGDPLVYDYMGSWTEAPSEWTVPLIDAQAALYVFIRGDAAGIGGILFQAE